MSDMAGRRRARQAAVGLAEFFAPVTDPEEAVDFTAPLARYRRKMAHCREKVVEADYAHQDQLRIQAKLFRHRTELSSALSNKLVRLRRLCLGLLQDEELKEWGLDGAVAQDPVAVLRQGQKAQRNFQQPDLDEIESPEWMAIKVHAEPIVQALESNVRDLDLTIQEIARQRRRIEDAAAEKGQAFTEFDTNYLLIGRSTEACFRMGGMDEAADRARPSTRRLAAGADGDEAAEEAEAQAAADSADTETPPEVEKSEPPPDA